MPIPINTLMRAVVANPDAYAGAFPTAAEPASVAFDIETQAVIWEQLANAGPYADYQRMVLERMAQLTGHVSSFEGGLPAQPAATMVQAHLNRDSVAWRGLDRARDRVDGSYSVRMTPVRYTDGGTRFVTDEALSADGVVHLRTHEPPRRIDYFAYGDRRGLAPEMVILDEADQTIQAALSQVSSMTLGERPTHHRVHPGRCACGFESIYSADMETHLLGPSGHNWLTVCECGLKTYCREVRVPRAASLGWSASFDPTQGPTDDRVWLCVGCRERRGIH